MRNKDTYRANMPPSGKMRSGRPVLNINRLRSVARSMRRATLRKMMGRWSGIGDGTR